MPTIPQADLEQYGEVIDRLVTTPVGKSRGNMFQPMKAVDMYDAARAKFGRPLCLLAAELISERVKRDDNVLILTGSYHPLHFPVGEMDGPPGGATLALSLDLGLGAKPFFANEPPLVNLMEEACRAVGLLPMPYEQAIERDHTAVVLSFPITDHEGSRRAAEELMDRYDFSLVVTSERLGRNRKGRYHSAGGTEREPQDRCKVDHIVDVARERGILTVSVGDGGNEIGFGSIFEETRGIVNWGETCRCPCEDGIVSVVESDALIVAATSNWGISGLEAALAMVNDNQDMMHDAAAERRVLHHLANMGCADGATVMTTPTCDDTPESVSLDVVNILKATVAQSFRVNSRRF
jgi:hypothetical protein